MICTRSTALRISALKIHFVWYLLIGVTRSFDRVIAVYKPRRGPMNLDTTMLEAFIHGGGWRRGDKQGSGFPGYRTDYYRKFAFSGSFLIPG